jgi:hypothetical protein
VNDRTDFLHPDYEPGEFDRVERELRRALAEESSRITPGNRLNGILHEAHEAGPIGARGGSRARRWLMPLAAAAAVAAIAGGVWFSNQDDAVTPSPPAHTPTATQPSPSLTSPPTSPPSSAPSQTPTSSAPSSTGPVTTQAVSLPVYFVGPVGDAKPTYKLFREYVRASVPKTPTDDELAKAALTLAVNAQPYSNTDGYLQPWSGQTIGDVRVTPEAITVTLANRGAEGFTPEVQRLAVQELVWTAQAAVQKGNLPVRFEIAGGSTKLFGSISTDQTFSRPGKDELWKDLAPIWVTSPARDQVLPASKKVVVQGQAIVFEANVGWQLSRGRSEVKSGHAMASIGAPSQGSFSIDLGALKPGDYTIRVFEASPKDGSISAEKSVSFTVR